MRLNGPLPKHVLVAEHRVDYDVATAAFRFWRGDSGLGLGDRFPWASQWSKSRRLVR